jgi:hypothetical protein
MRGRHHLGFRIEGDLVKLWPGDEQGFTVESSELAEPEQRKLHGVPGAALAGALERRGAAEHTDFERPPQGCVKLGLAAPSIDDPSPVVAEPVIRGR